MTVFALPGLVAHRLKYDADGLASIMRFTFNKRNSGNSLLFRFVCYKHFKGRIMSRIEW